MKVGSKDGQTRTSSHRWYLAQGRNPLLIPPYGVHKSLAIPLMAFSQIAQLALSPFTPKLGIALAGEGLTAADALDV